MFVNEFVTPEDVRKYRLVEIDEKFVVGQTNARDWTIDRENDSYLRNVSIGGGSDPDLRNQLRWTFYWKGHELTLRIDSIDGNGSPGEIGWSHWRLVWINGKSGLPASLKPYTIEILADLKSALVAYQGFGIYSASYSSYSVTLDLDEECVL